MLFLAVPNANRSRSGPGIITVLYLIPYYQSKNDIIGSNLSHVYRDFHFLNYVDDVLLQRLVSCAGLFSAYQPVHGYKPQNMRSTQQPEMVLSGFSSAHIPPVTQAETVFQSHLQ